MRSRRGQAYLGAPVKGAGARSTVGHFSRRVKSSSVKSVASFQRSLWLIYCDGWRSKRGQFSAGQVSHKGNGKSDKPGIIVKINEEWSCAFSA